MKFKNRIISAINWVKENVWNNLRTGKGLFFIVLFFVVFGIIYCFDKLDTTTEPLFWHSLLLNNHSIIFDILLFGVLQSFFEQRKAVKEKQTEADRQKAESIKRLTDLIEDYRNWKSQEATFRIYGAHKRLTDLGVRNVDLSYCYFRRANLFEANLIKANLFKTNLTLVDLRGANLIEANLTVANLRGANLSEAFLIKANLYGATLNKAKLIGTRLRGADLRGATLRGADLRDANLIEATCFSADLRRADLRDANLTDANLSGALVEENWFEKIKEQEVIGADEIINKYEIKERELSSTWRQFNLEEKSL